jgi:hypothetical protein
MSSDSASSRPQQTVPKPKRKPPPGITVLPPEHFESLPVAEREWIAGQEKKQARMRNIFPR